MFNANLIDYAYNNKKSEKKYLFCVNKYILYVYNNKNPDVYRGFNLTKTN